MTEQNQTRLGMQNSILSPASVRRITPDNLGITAPEQDPDDGEDRDDTDQQDDMRKAAVEAATHSEEEPAVGVAARAVDDNIYTGISVGGNGWGTHAIELAVSKAVSEGAAGVSNVVIYSHEGQSELCGRCLQALTDTQDGEVTVELHSSEGIEDRFGLTEVAPWTSD